MSNGLQVGPQHTIGTRTYAYIVEEEWWTLIIEFVVGNSGDISPIACLLYIYSPTNVISENNYVLQSSASQLVLRALMTP